MNTFGSKILTTRATNVLIDEFMTNLRQAEKAFGVSVKPLIENMDMDYTEFADKCLPVATVVACSDKHRTMSTAMEDTNRFTAILDNMWALHNGNIFVMDIEEALRLPNIDSLENVDLDSISDCYINFVTHDTSRKKNYLQFYLSLLKDNEQISTQAHKNMDSYALTFGLAGNSGMSYQVRFTKELFPRFMKISDFKDCKGCKNTTSLKYEFMVQGHMQEMKACLIGKQQREICSSFNYILNPQVAINIMAYAAEMYQNRHTLIRKNSRSIKDYENKPHMDVICKRSTDNKDAEIPLLQYVKGEGTEYIPRPGTKHMHHESPREHLRREHTRQLKSGKVIVVKESTVNKGKSKTIYKI